MDVHVRTLRDGERELAWDIDQEAFNSSAAERDRWIAHLDPDRTYGAFVDDELVAIARCWPMGQFFGGRSVPMGGVASVAVRPEHRGRGYASAVVQAMFPAMRERGEAVSSLSPATTRLYRGLGYELAGHHGWNQVPTRSLLHLPAGAGDSVRRASLDDLPAVQACYGRSAAGVNGFVDRSEPWWRYRLEARWDERTVFVVDGDDGEVDGYVVVRRTAAPGGWGHVLEADDMAACHPDAWLALWRVLASSASQVPEVRWVGPPEDPLRFVLPEQDVRPHGPALRWMLRLVDAPAAVAARGFPKGLEVSVDLRIRDRLCPWNDDHWHLTVAGGRGHLEPRPAVPADEAVQLAIGPFASLWAGYATPAVLAATGRLAGGTGADRDALTAAFAGPTPWMSDFF